MTPESRIAILSFSCVARDARVLRQVEYLSKHFEITVLGYGKLRSHRAHSARMIRLQPPTALRRRGRKLVLLPLGRAVSRHAYEAWYWTESEYRNALEILRHSDIVAIHANDWEALPVAVRAARQNGAQVVVDLHEYAPSLQEHRSYWRWFYKPMIDHFLREYLPHAARSVTVSPSIASEYQREYGIQPTVVKNVPHYETAPAFHPTDPDQIRLVHHGNAMRGRRLELMIETVARLDPRYSLHFMLLDRNRGYVSDLRGLARRLAPKQVFFHDPVPPAEIVDRVSSFDMGIYLMPSANFNQSAALPNKFFDFIAAGLAVCIGPSPEMARLTRQFGLGLVAPSLEPECVAASLNALSPARIDQMKRRSIKARGVLNADAEMAKLIELYQCLL